MSKIAVAVLSTSGMDYLKENNEVSNVRLTVFFDGKEYVDHTEIKAEDFYQMMLDKPNADIHTSQVSTGAFQKLYEDVRDKGFNELVVVSISSKLSGTYQGAILAKELVEGIRVEVIDSKSVSFGEAVLGLRALELVKKGQTLDQIVEDLNAYKSRTKIFVLVDTLKYLVKNGRLSAAAGLIGTLLKIKPLLKIMEDGSLKPYEKIRTTTKAQKRIMEIVLEETQGKKVDFYIAYTTNLEKAQSLEAELREARPDANVTIIPLTPVVGAHAGPGTLGLGYALLD
ncbi:DegV domain-containing protein SAV0749 [Acholeplasma oculi]|uniref:DAK1/DegV-like superfamily protein n=1 Tax=Acholeplasma oculi TaxID=35623 RepID=A0A061AIJ2_9MOLU|nr:DegV family protein [Acholeplasma oculi]CDR31446.1 DAK1/DegV-like superfamily protein [Acholeplasma oculi]SKC40064.1 EDD domain protein, DegV family [Acholeplasma oculi]SUT92075.1 DegV domain-containing protein SAV0749 [Acholeplasma oculi]